MSRPADLAARREPVSGATRRRKLERRVLAFALGLLLSSWLPVLVRGQSTRIGPERYWWLGDDAMISMTYARNLAQGHGLVWRPDERVEGYSNFLWTLWMVLPHLLRLPSSKTSLMILISNLVLSAWLLVVLQRLVRLLDGGPLSQASVAIAAVLHRAPFVWGVMGFETVLLSLLVTASVLRILQDARRSHPRQSTYWLVGSVALVRADAAVLTGMLLILAWLVDHRGRRLLPRQAPALLLPVLHLAFRRAYYGSWLPNTAFLKTTGWSGRYAAGLTYTGTFLLDHLPLLLLAAAGVVLHRRLSSVALLLPCVGFTAYVTAVGGDAFTDHRFLVPVLPLLLVAGLGWIDTLRRPRWLAPVLAVLAVGSLPLWVTDYDQHLRPSPEYVGNLRIALLIRENTDRASTVAVTWAGAIPYFSERRGVDLLGKSDPVIARRPAVEGLTVPGHNKFDFDHSLGWRRADLLVSDLQLPVNDLDMALLKQHPRVGFVGHLYFHPIFQQHYLPNPVWLDEWHTIFVADGSPELARRNRWFDLD